MFTAIFQLDSLNKDALEVSSLVRSVTNKLAPINKLPDEVLTLIPQEFRDRREKEEIVVTLTHVCRRWRKVFVSCASLWSGIYCMDAHKTRVYLERSKSSPINLWLEREQGLISDDPFLEIAPRSISRLWRLYVKTTPDHFQAITKYLVQPAPFLKVLVIDGGTATTPDSTPVLATELFGGDLSSLSELYLRSVHTQLPWRNMDNLTSFVLGMHPTVSLGQILDFFESAPRLLVVDLISATPAIGTQDRRPVALAHLRRLTIYGFHPPAVLLNHLMLPAGARTSIRFYSQDPRIDEFLPRSPENLRNLSNFTTVRIHFEQPYLRIRLTGPNGRASFSSSLRTDATHLATQALARLDTSNIKQLDIISGVSATSEIHQAIRSMTNLRTLRIFPCDNAFLLSLTLQLEVASTDVIACPKLEEFVCSTPEAFDIGMVADLAQRRASKGVPLKSVRVVGLREPLETEGVAKLREYVSHVETSAGGEGDSYDLDEDSDEEYWL